MSSGRRAFIVENRVDAQAKQYSWPKIEKADLAYSTDSCFLAKYTIIIGRSCSPEPIQLAFLSASSSEG
jgi:hypothetical protein